MAVTITVGALKTALRLEDTTEENAEAARLLAYCTEAVTRYLGAAAFADAPDVAVDEGVRRLAGYLFDMPNAGRGAAFADALRNSGALQVLAPYRPHRAGVVSSGAE